MVAHAGTLSVFGRHGRRSDRRAAVVVVRSQRTIIVISTRRDDAAFRLSGAVSIAVLLIVCISDAQLTVDATLFASILRPKKPYANAPEMRKRHANTHGHTEWASDSERVNEWEWERVITGRCVFTPRGRTYYVVGEGWRTRKTHRNRVWSERRAPTWRRRATAGGGEYPKYRFYFTAPYAILAATPTRVPYSLGVLRRYLPNAVW